MALQKLRESAVPFEVVGLSGSFIGSVLVLAGGEFPISIVATLPHWAQTVWAAALCTGCLLGLTGLWWPRDPADGLLMEACGVYLAGAACCAYALAIAFVQPPGTVYTSLGLIGGFGIACLWRGVLLASTMRRAARRATALRSGEAS